MKRSIENGPGRAIAERHDRAIFHGWGPRDRHVGTGQWLQEACELRAAKVHVGVRDDDDRVSPGARDRKRTPELIGLVIRPYRVGRQNDHLGAKAP